MPITPEATKPELSIVIPVYYSAKIFPELHKRLAATLDQDGGAYEVIAVVDGCRDDSFKVISEIGSRVKNVKAIEFSRNFGHQAAITAGLRFASGDRVAIMDDDLEDPPEALPALLAKQREGFDVVYGVRRARKRSLFHRALYKIFYRLFGILVDVEVPNDAGDFCVMSRRVVNVINAMRESSRYLRGMRAWSGFEQTGVEYDRGQRFASHSGYNLRKYFALAMDATFSFSYKPLRFMLRIGFIIALLSFLFGIRLIVLKWLGLVPNVRGWASLFTAILFFSGVQLFCIGVIGEYIARIYDEVKRRPQFIIKNFSAFTEKEIRFEEFGQ